MSKGIDQFEEGELYSHDDHEEYVMVLGIGKETKTKVVLAILWVEREGLESTSFGELEVKKSDFKNWEAVKL